jgi:site-specific DNA-methyltransferase (adenine-specific)
MDEISDFEDFKTYCGNAIDAEEVVKDRVDMIFADPPYFLSKGRTLQINGQWKSFEKGEWDHTRSMDEINAFNLDWISTCRKLLKPDGTIWVCGTYHNIFSVAVCLQQLGFKILNIIVWQKSDPRPTLSTQYFSFTAEYIVWARRDENKLHYFDCAKMEELNDGHRMPDVWQIPIVRPWEMRCGQHPTQKPLKLLHRIILASTRPGETILDPFAGSCTTGIAANLLGRKFIGIDQQQEYLEIGNKRRCELESADKAGKMLKMLNTNPSEPMVMVNHVRKSTRQLMIDKGICYLRAGDSKGSLLVKPGFERLQYVLLHTNGDDCQLFKLKTKGSFQIWTKETLEQHGFKPSNAPYYIVLLFNAKDEIPINKELNLKSKYFTYIAKIRPLSEVRG